MLRRVCAHHAICNMKNYLLLIYICLASAAAYGGTGVSHKPGYRISGTVIDAKSREPIACATIYLPDSELWAIADDNGEFAIEGLSQGLAVLNVKYIGYEDLTVKIDVSRNVSGIVLKLQESSLALDEVVVTAQRRSGEETTSYLIDRRTLDHAQIINVGHIGTLLPGGKTIGDQNLASSDARIALRSERGEMGNASFGTAVAVDGVRLQNNSAAGETMGADVRNISSANIESVEIITGIPSVEHGDLANGIVKINTRKGRTPLYIDLGVEPKTKQAAVSKGWQLNGERGTLNASIEHTKSVTNIVSPHTDYARNTLSLTYSNTFGRRGGHPLTLTAGMTGNIGGYNSEADPDAFRETYVRTRDYALRGSLKLDWLLNKLYITNLSFTASAAYSDKLSETRTNQSSASTQPYIHTTENGYFVASKYDDNPDANIILSPTGYWHLSRFSDSKPIDFAMKIKAGWTRRWGDAFNRIMAGAEWNSSANMGRGEYYDDMRHAPTWREYRHDKLPSLNNYALYVEDRLRIPVRHSAALQITAGLRSDITDISQSEYGTACSLSPRVSAKYILWEGKPRAWSDLTIFGGFGKAVKLPSFEVLYPPPSYSDKLAFASASAADNTAYYAYYTIPSKAVYNENLKWQHSRQAELGAEAQLAGIRMTLSAFFSKTYDPYMAVREYMPYTYKQTTQEYLDGCSIPSADRLYHIDQTTGIVSVSDRTGRMPAQQLPYKERQTFQGRTKYTNGSPITRSGIEWTIDFPQIASLMTTVRADGRHYYYKGLDETLCASMPSSASTMADGNPYKYIGFYKGTTTGSASVANGSCSRQTDMNLTITTHIPRVRMILSVRIEGSLYSYKQNLCEYSDGDRGIALDSAGDYFGSGGSVYDGDRYVAVYPIYYTTWDAPGTPIPFAEKFAWARENDTALYNELSKLVVKSNTAYYFNPARISASYSANINLTKEIGDIAAVTFFARNFFCNTGTVKSTQTGQVSTLYNSAYVPKFYYGMSLRLKL